MKSLLNYISVIFISALLFSCDKEVIDETGFGTVKGRVVKEETFEPLANVKVSSNPATSSVFTDENGYYTLYNVPTGTYAFQAQKDGFVARFESGTVPLNNTIEIVFELKPQEEKNLSPTTPLLTSPADNDVNQTLTVPLTWTCTDPENDVLTFEVILRNDSNTNVQTFSDITTQNLTLTNLNYSTKYYWQVSVSDGTNPPVMSAIRSFRTIDFPNARYLFVRKIGGNDVIFTANDAGEELRLTSTSLNSYRPRKNTQANKIAFIQSDGAQGQIYTMKPDGTEIFKVTNSVPVTGFNLEYVNFSWSGNGSQIIYPNFDKLYRINADGSGLIQIYQTTGGKFISECDWSVDGSLIAIKTNDVNGYNAEVLVIDQNGNLVTTVLTGLPGAVGGLHFSVNNQKLLYTRDISGYQAPNYRQLDTRVFMYDFLTSTATEPDIGKPAGTNDLDVRYSPNEAEIIVMNTSNDGVSTKYIQRIALDFNTTNNESRETLFTDAIMPDWK